MIKKIRKPIPEKISSKLLVDNRHRCCICRKPRKPVQIHHIDSNPSNNEVINLAVLCPNCHSDVTSDQGFGKKYSVQAVTSYKQIWESRCNDWLNETNPEIDERIEEDEDTILGNYFDDVIENETNIPFHYNLTEGQIIILGVLSDNPMQVAIMRKVEYKKWIHQESILEYEKLFENVTDFKQAFVVPEDDKYTVVIINDSSVDANVQADITIWDIE